MYEHVEAHVFLHFHGFGDLGFQEGVVLGIRHAPLLVGGAGLAHFLGLRKRADGGRGIGRQVHLGVLFLRAFGVGRAALAVLVGDRGGAALDRGVVDARGVRTIGHRLLVVRQHGLVELAVGGVGQEHDLVEFFFGEGEPVLELVVELGFAAQGHRRMQQRTARAHDQTPRANLALDGLDRGERAFQIGLPDIATIDDADGQIFLVVQPRSDDFGLLDTAHRIDMQCCDRQRREQLHVVGKLAEVVRDHDLDAVDLREPRISLLDDRALGVVQVQRKDRLVDLQPFGAVRGQFLGDLDIDLDQRIGQIELVQIRAVGDLAECQISGRANHHRLGDDALCLGLGKLVEDLRADELKRRVLGELGDDVVVVGIEPLGHLAGDRALSAARHVEGDVDIHVAAVPAKTLGHVADQTRQAQDLIVEGEIVGRDQIDAGRLLLGPVGAAQFRARGLEPGVIEIALPVGLGRLLEFAAFADTGEAQVVGYGHKTLCSVAYRARRGHEWIRERSAMEADSVDCVMHE